MARTFDLNQIVVPTGQVLYVDVNRTDSYNEDGSYHRPFKTFSAANSAASSNPTCFIVFPGTISGNHTFPDDSTIVGSGATNTIFTGTITTGASVQSISDCSFTGDFSTNVSNTKFIASNCFFSGFVSPDFLSFFINCQFERVSGDCVNPSGTNHLTDRHFFLNCTFSTGAGRCVNQGRSTSRFLNCNFENNSILPTIEAGETISSVFPTATILIGCNVNNAGAGSCIDLVEGAALITNPNILDNVTVNGNVVLGSANSFVGNVLGGTVSGSAFILQSSDLILNDSTVSGVAVSDALETLDSSKEDAANKGAASGYAPLGADSKVPSAYLPSLVITDIDTAADATAHQNVENEQGDVVIRLDTGDVYIKLNNNAAPTTIATDYQKIESGSAVTSVNGQTGPSVTLDTGDIAENGNLYFTNARADGRIAAASINDLSNVNITLTANRAVRVNGAGTGLDETTFALPTGNGSNGQVLQTDGAGGTAWATVSGGGTPSIASKTDNYNIVSGDDTVLFNASGVDSVDATDSLTGSDINASSNSATSGNAIDNDDATQWAAVSAGTQYLRVDLGSGNERPVNKITLQTEKSGGTSRIAGFTLKGTNVANPLAEPDGGGWTTIYTGSYDTSGANGLLPVQTFEFDNDVSYRGYLLSVTASNPAAAAGVREWELFYGYINAVLPDASTVSGEVFTIKKVDNSSNRVLLSAASGNIDGVASRFLTQSGESLTLQSDGTNYQAIQSFSEKDATSFSNLSAQSSDYSVLPNDQTISVDASGSGSNFDLTDSVAKSQINASSNTTQFSAIDNNESTEWASLTAGTHYLRIDFGSGNAKVFNRIALVGNRVGGVGRINGFTVKGTNVADPLSEVDGSGWTTIYSGVYSNPGPDGVQPKQEFSFENSTAYRGFLISTTATNPAAGTAIRELEIYDKETVLLPAASDSFLDGKGQEFDIQKTDSSNLFARIASESGDIGEGPGALLKNQYSSLRLKSNGTNYQIMGGSKNSKFSIPLKGVDRSIAGNSIVANGTFNSDLSSWTDVSSGGGSAAYTASNGGSVDLTSSGTGFFGQIRQAVAYPFVAGERYKIKVLKNSHSGTTDAFIAAYEQDATTVLNAYQAAASTITNGSTFELEFTATATTQTNGVINVWLGYGGAGTAGTLNLDNVRVTDGRDRILLNSGKFVNQYADSNYNADPEQGNIVMNSSGVISKLSCYLHSNSSSFQFRISVFKNAVETGRFLDVFTSETGAKSIDLGVDFDAGDLISVVVAHDPFDSASDQLADMNISLEIEN